MFGKARHADRDRDVPIRFTLGLNDYVFDALTDLLGAMAGFFERGVWQDQHEFLAAVASRDVFSPNMGLQETPKVMKDNIASFVPLIGFEFLEMIQIEHDDSHGSSPARRAMQLPVERFAY